MKHRIHIKHKKDDMKALRQLMLSNSSPEIDSGRKQDQLKLLAAKIQETDYRPRQCFPERLLNAISCFTPWIWLLQAGFLALLFVYVGLQRRYVVTACMMMLPLGLTLILLYELSKSFSSNMWEMEAACLYNLPQHFFLKLCILSGTDFIVLGTSLAAFHMTGGLLWQFEFYTLLPFFLMSALCLRLLRHLGNRCSRTTLTSISLSAGCIWSLLAVAIENLSQDLADIRWQKEVILWATLAAFGLFVFNAVGLCTQKYYENSNSRKDNKAWNFD